MMLKPGGKALIPATVKMPGEAAEQDCLATVDWSEWSGKRRIRFGIGQLSFYVSRQELFNVVTHITNLATEKYQPKKGRGRPPKVPAEDEPEPEPEDDEDQEDADVPDLSHTIQQ